WLKREGDRVEVGEPLVELETEKIDLEVGAEHGGVLASIKRHEGEDVKVGELLAVVDDGAAAQASSAAASSASASARAGTSAGGRGNGSGGVEPAGQPTPAPPQPAVQAAGAAASSDAPRATPTARRMARDHDVDLGSVPGSGSAGRVMKQDVVGAIGARSAEPSAPPAPRAARAPETPSAPPPPRRTAGERREERVRMSKRRLTIARRLVEAQHTAAMLTTFNEIDMTEMMSLRERRKEAFKKHYGVGLGIASFFVKAAVAALRAFPPLNAEIQGEEIVLKHYYDIAMAAGAEGGLVVPVIRDADQRSFAEIEMAIRDFSKRARAGTLTLHHL